jgi:hypothetical protein
VRGDPAGSGGSASDLELLESVLRRAEGVRHAAVVLRDGRPAAYVAPASAAGAALRAHVAAGLPGSPVPEITLVDALPVTANGRVDRATLAAPGYGAPAAAGYVAPRTEAERVLAQVWADVLGVDRVGIEDNFFDLSGDSIDTIRLACTSPRETCSSSRPWRRSPPRPVRRTRSPNRPSPPLLSLSQQETDAIEAKWR